MSRRSRDSPEAYREDRRRKKHRRDSSDSEDHRRRRERHKSKRKRDYEDDRRDRRRRRDYSRSSEEPDKQPRDKTREKEEGEADKYAEQRVVVENVDEDDVDGLMGQIMGFSEFSTSKNKNHMATSEEYVSKANRNKRQYRTYMNKKAATNRNEQITM